MYAWIWRRLPFGLPGRLIGSIGLVVAVAALLWYVVFPWAEPLLPFDDVQVTQQDDGGVPAEAPGAGPGTGEDAGVGPGPSREPSLGDNDIPYATHSNNPEPTRSR
jgi:hypothetical protein